MQRLNSPSFRRENGKTITFWALDPNFQAVDEEMWLELEDVALVNEKCNARICLHTDPAATFHDMIVLEWPNSYFPPHAHPKAESLQILRGTLGVFTFDEAGNVTERCVLRADGEALLCRIGASTIHWTVPLTSPAIYRETKQGPFLGTHDRVFPRWAPAAGEDRTEFLKRLPFIGMPDQLA
jgi:cupin fold WbuC family metalloprotein